VVLRRRIEGDPSLDSWDDYAFSFVQTPRIADLLAKGALKISWRITDHRHPGRAIHPEFPAEGVKGALEALFKLGCTSVPPHSSSQ
jgi:hypothetical protein